jgi:hypothetical protein
MGTNAQKRRVKRSFVVAARVYKERYRKNHKKTRRA